MTADLRTVSRQLDAAGVASPDWDARALIDHAATTGLALDTLVARRAEREPLQHILGVAWFRHLELAVGPGVFLPRPETELLVDAALAAMHDLAAPIVVDLCAGSGAIGLAVAQERAMAGRGCTVHLVEASTDAMTWLRANDAALNAHLHALPPSATTVSVHHADLDAAPTGLDATVDVVVSNPPYLPLASRDCLDIETERHDPQSALFGGEDGLEVIRRVVARAAELLRPGGHLIIEHDMTHDLATVLTGWTGITMHTDLTGRPRFTEAARP